MNWSPHRFVSGGRTAECPVVPATLGDAFAILGVALLDIEVHHDSRITKWAVSFTRLYGHREHAIALGTWETQFVGVGRHIRVRDYETRR